MARWAVTSVAVALSTGLCAAAPRAQTPTDWASVRQEETAREARQRVADIFDAMRVRPGAVVADVGAGGGFLTVRLARAVGTDGRVLAVDIEPRVLESLRERVRQESLTNVEVIRGDEDDPHLAPASLDAAVIVNAYHEMRAYHAILHQLRRALKPDGRLVIVEPLSEKRRHESREAMVKVHEIALPFVEEEVRSAGFRVARTEDPFTTQASEMMWLLVAVPDPHGWSTTTATSDVAAPSSGQEETPSALSNSDLRVTPDRFKELLKSGRVVVVDVRTEEEYQVGHIPGAISVPLENIEREVERLRALRKPIVTYCS